MAVKKQGSQSEYARYRGVSEAAVSKAISSGRIQAAVNGRVVDFVKADRLWAANSRPRPEPETTAQLKSVPQMGAAHRETTRATAARSEPASYRQRREKAEAELAEVKSAKARGAVVERTEVSRTFHAIGRMFSAAREAIPAQIAPRLVGKTDLLEIEMVLKAALRDADTRIADEIESRFAEITGGTDGGSGGSDAHD